ncbi:MAG: hypothetical protein ACREIW_09340 [Chthoniobacterales bacterium]
MKIGPLCVSLAFFATTAGAQIQIDIKLKRFQYIAYEPLMATISITNLAGRDVDFRNAAGQSWFGFEITGKDGEPIALLPSAKIQPPLTVSAGKKVTQRIDLNSLFPMHEFGTYHVRAHIYFADLDKFFYSQAKVVEITGARPIWQKTVGMPDGAGSGNARTYSLLSNRFADHTSLYVRVEDKDSGVVYRTYSLGHAIAFGEPQTDIDQANQLHVLHCAAPRTWAYSHVGLNGELLAHSTFMETKSRPRLVHTPEGNVAVRGGMLDQPEAASVARPNVPKLSDRPAELPRED